MDKRLVFKETRGVDTCEFCGAAVTRKEWSFVDEQGEECLVKDAHGRVIRSMPSTFLNVCEGCGRGAEHELEIVQMVQAVAKGEIVFDEDDEDFET